VVVVEAGGINHMVNLVVLVEVEDMVDKVLVLVQQHNQLNQEIQVLTVLEIQVEILAQVHLNMVQVEVVVLVLLELLVIMVQQELLIYLMAVQVVTEELIQSLMELLQFITLVVVEVLQVMETDQVL
jgi:hypothetical protein